MAGFPQDRDTICPAWCELPSEHILVLDDAWQTWHRGIVGEFAIPEFDGSGEKKTTVELMGYVDFKGRECPPFVKISLPGKGSAAGEVDLTPREARALADILREAADLAEGNDPPEVC